MAELPLKGWPADVFEPLADVIAKAVASKSISEFYIGRTDDLTATKSRHGADDIHALYETQSTPNAIEVEDTLIKALIDHPKCSNDNDHGGGGTSNDFVNYVYLAMWYS